MNQISKFAPPHLREVDEQAVEQLERVLTEVEKRRETRGADVEYAAYSLDRLRHRDMREFCKAIWGDTPPTSAAELADRIGDWADAHRSREE
jgi:hypothetical protein